MGRYLQPVLCRSILAGSILEVAERSGLDNILNHNSGNLLPAAGTGYARQVTVRNILQQLRILSH